ncbi:phage terminase large subunit [Loktanella sp. 3ANDIMAR09]|uniref:phage terminase large subunit n=1 Tax=Loktanella sp. 3ANDIMAR09 TaxID=1225657 RepID=UPI0009FB91C4|nr:phage terminase large subunit [Loktanella sp. 3ANDIMAR09]
MSHDLTVSAPQGVYLSQLDTKFRSFVGGFGSGKTYVGALDLGLFAAKHPKLVQGYFAPTYRDIRDTFWPTMDEAGSALGFRVKVKSADKEVEFYRGRAYYGTIICRSMDDPGGIVGFKIARANVDEIDVLPTEKAANAWRKIIARMRLVVPGVVNGIGVTTTPEGFKFVYETFKRNPGTDYSMVQASTYENERFLPPDYIQSLRDTYPQELIDAYLMGEFVNLTSGTVYSSYDRVACGSTETIQPGEPLKIGMDFNVGNMAAKVFVVRGDSWHCVDEITGGRDTPSMIDTLKERYAGHHVTIYPDASGKNASSKGASLSDIGLLRQAGFTIRAKDSNPRVKDRVLSVNKAFEAGKVRVNATTAPSAARCLEQQAYDKNGEPDKASGLDHDNDAFGYPIAYEMPVIKPRFDSRSLRL